ncbi:MAG: hypothetical protein WD077_05065 [Bacteroidia bacterium]
MKYLLFFFFTAAIMASSCRKEPVDCCDDDSCPHIFDCLDDSYFTDTIFKPQQFLDYWYFEKGSWWVYQRMDTNATVYDTVRVIATVRNIYCDFNQGPVCAESALMNMRHSNSFFFRKDSASLSQILGSSTNFNLSDESVHSNGYIHNGFLMGVGSFFQWPIRIGDEYFHGNIVLDSNVVITPYGTLSNTVHIQINYSTSAGGEIWITRNIGFTRMKFYPPQSENDLPESEWALVDYHVVQ